MQEVGFDETAVPVLLAIPLEVAETSRPNATKPIKWRLTVSAKVPGIDYKSAFEVPVFKTAESRGDFKLDERLAGQYDARPDATTILREAGILKEDLAGGGVRLTFSMARNRGVAVFLTVFLIVWSVALWLLTGMDAPFWFRAMFLSIWSLFELILIWITLDMWLYRGVVEVT